ncbi:DUF4278 domain-containing protein [Nostoc sp. CHAB 5844]|nr:DUF4278 domain-containing protein [Nostoc sp. CHAB 5844]
MVLCFLILVCICLITGYFLLKESQREIAHLLGIFGTISLILALVLAPWQILLILLIPVFISTNFKYHTNKLNSTQIEYPQQPISKLRADHHLIYRGVYYCTKSDGLTVSPGTYQLSYRGSTYLSCIDAQTPKLTPPLVTCQLRFRGSPYYINKTTPIKNQRSSSEFEAITTNSLPVAH